MKKEDVLNEFLYLERLNTTQLANILGVKTGVVSAFKTRGLSKNYATKIKSLYPKYSLHWLLTGDGDMLEIKAENVINCGGNATNNTQTSSGINKELLDELIEQRKMFQEQIDRLLTIIEKK